MRHSEPVTANPLEVSFVLEKRNFSNTSSNNFGYLSPIWGLKTQKQTNKQNSTLLFHVPSSHLLKPFFPLLSHPNQGGCFSTSFSLVCLCLHPVPVNNLFTFPHLQSQGRASRCSYVFLSDDTSRKEQKIISRTENQQQL